MVLIYRQLAFALFIIAAVQWPAHSGNATPQRSYTMKPLVTDFTRLARRSSTAFSLEDWEVVTANWGSDANNPDYSGGVIAENVSQDGDGLILSANGNLYEGPLRGRGGDGMRRPDGKRTGAALRSKKRFLGGRFEACVTIPPVLGVVSALWTFRYEEETGSAPRNHEIDIEFPGQSDAATPVDLDHVNFTTWVDLGKDGHTTAYTPLSSRASDGKFHLLRFDWIPPANNTEGRVDFYIDNQQLASIDKTVPSLPGQVWFGLWFPPLWAGVPDFDSVTMRVKWVRAGASLDERTPPPNDLRCE